MDWEPEVSAGDWLRERIDEPWRGTMHDVVPRGFAAYARILHPASVQSLPGGEAMPAPEEWASLPWERIEAIASRTRHDPIRWRDAAARLGTTMHPTTPWHRLIDRPWDAAGHAVLLDDGRWLDPPDQGRLDDAAMRALLPVLSAHTADPADAYAAVWEGWGGLVGHLGYDSSTSALVGDVDAHHRAMVYSSLRDILNRGFRKPRWQPGLLPDEVSRGPRLTLPNRDHVLFRGALRELAADEVPWREPGGNALATTPSLLWPAERSWVVVTEVDADSTIVCGDASLVDAVCDSPHLEALPIPEGSLLYGDAAGGDADDGDADGAAQ